MSIRVEIFSKNLDLTENIREYATSKAAKLDRFLDSIDEARVDLAYVKTARDAKDRFIAQITLRGRGFILRSEERAIDIAAAIDLVIDKIQRQIERYKGKKFRNLADRKPLEPSNKVSNLETQKVISSPVVRHKRFTLTPMDENEAIEQMNMLGHEDFFIFYNVKTSMINVLYRRRDGGYGVIEPELV
jgi:putative sigma-54 modulation protein